MTPQYLLNLFDYFFYEDAYFSQADAKDIQIMNCKVLFTRIDEFWSEANVKRVGDYLHEVLTSVEKGVVDLPDRETLRHRLVEILEFSEPAIK